MKKVIKTIDEDINIENNQLLLSLDTTGLNNYKEIIYLAGFIRKNNYNKFELIQYICQDLKDEITILENTISLLNQYKKIITFNGLTFDIPFVQKRCQHYKINHIMSSDVVDINKLARQYHFIFPNKDFKKRSLSDFFNIDYSNILTYEETISNFKKYMISKDCDLANILLKNNLKKLINLSQLTVINNYIKEKTHLFVNGEHFKICKVFINKNFLEIEGIYKGSKMREIYHHNYLFTTNNISRDFALKMEIKEAPYTNNVSCTYIEKQYLNNDIISSKDYDSPNNILLISLGSKLLYDNIYNLLLSLLV